LDQHRDFAMSHGKPFALPEWGNRYSATGDSVEYVDLIHEFAVAHGGTGAGQLRYELDFNVFESPNDFAIFPTSRSLAPVASLDNQRLF
jgi:hypothetical protein